MSTSEFAQPRDQIFCWIWSIANVSLIALTWKLWFPGFTQFPRVPALAQVVPVALPLGHIAAVGLVVGFVMVALRMYSRIGLALIAASFGIAFLGNRHCLQPWAWQAFIIAVLLMLQKVADAKVWIAKVLISIYFFSAIGKFDYQFAWSLGISFVDVVLGWFRIADPPLGMSKPIMALLFPAIELLIAVGLVFKGSRKVAAIAAIVLHFGLIAILSPIGLGHRAPVLLWNVLTIFLVYWIFLERESKDKRSTLCAHGGWQTIVAALFAAIVILGPFLRPLQLWDHWLAWGLYSPSNSRVELFVADVVIEDLSPSTRELIIQSNQHSGFSKFDLAKWSLVELNAPIYPEASFQRSVAIQWIQQNGLPDYAILEEFGPSNPINGRRERKSAF